MLTQLLTMTITHKFPSLVVHHLLVGRLLQVLKNFAGGKHFPLFLLQHLALAAQGLLVLAAAVEEPLVRLARYVGLLERDEHGGPALDLEDGLVARLGDAQRLQLTQPRQKVSFNVSSL